MRKLYVTRVPRDKVVREWGMCVFPCYVYITGYPISVMECYVKCNKNGEVKDWDTTLLYTVDELIIRNNVIIVPFKL